MPWVLTIRDSQADTTKTEYATRDDAEDARHDWACELFQDGVTVHGVRGDATFRWSDCGDRGSATIRPTRHTTDEAVAEQAADRPDAYRV
jgi:hypothetical protein